MGKAVLNRTGRRYDRDMRSRASLFALLFVVGFFVLPQFAHASIPFFGPIVPNATCPAGWGMIITVINNVIEFLLTLAIVFVAPLSIAYAGFLFVVNPVNAGGKEQAKKILTNTIVGIVIALAGWMIVDAVMAVLYNPGNVLGTWSSIINSGGAPVCLTQAGSAPGAGFAPAARQLRLQALPLQERAAKILPKLLIIWTLAHNPVLPDNVLFMFGKRSLRAV